MRRLIANLLTCWMLLLLPGAAALDLARPELLLPACCRTHGAHHCALTSGMAAVTHTHGPGVSGPGCPFTHMSRAAILLVPHVSAAAAGLPGPIATARIHAAKTLLIGSWLARLPPSRAPPLSA